MGKCFCGTAVQGQCPVYKDFDNTISYLSLKAFCNLVIVGSQLPPHPLSLQQREKSYFLGLFHLGTHRIDDGLIKLLVLKGEILASIKSIT